MSRSGHRGGHLQPTMYVELTALAMQRLTGVPSSEVDAGGTSAETVLPWLNRLSEELADHSANRRESLMRTRLMERLPTVVPARHG